MGRVVNAINEVCISLARSIPYSLNLVPEAVFPTSTSKAREKRPGNEVATPFDSSIKPFEREISGFKQSLLWVRKYSIYYSYVFRAGFLTTKYLHAFRILGIASRGCIASHLLFMSFQALSDYLLLLRMSILLYLQLSEKRNPPFSDNRMKSGAVIMINIGAVHGPVTKSDYPRPLSSVLWFVCLLEIVR